MDDADRKRMYGYIVGLMNDAECQLMEREDAGEELELHREVQQILWELVFGRREMEG